MTTQFGNCQTCTICLIKLAYRRQPIFRAVREPLRLGMRALAFLHRIDPNDYEVRTLSCRGCMRFYKVALKERSAMFRWLNRRVNPVFDAWLERIVSEAAVQEAKVYARAATLGHVLEGDDAVKTGERLSSAPTP